MKKFLYSLIAALFLAVAVPAGAADVAFSFTGANQQFVVPEGVTQVTVKAWGAGGDSAWQDLGMYGDPAEYGNGGGGGYATATLDVTPGQTLTIRVGGHAYNETGAGWPNGGAGAFDYENWFYMYGGGGGSSSVLLSGVVLVEAGGGSGGASNEAALAGGGMRTCSPSGNQQGANAGGWGSSRAFGGGYCAGSAAGSSYVPAGGTQTPGSGRDPGNASDSARNGAGVGSLWDYYSFEYPTHGRIVISY